MFIAVEIQSPPAPFEGAELNLAGIQVVSFRPFERRREIRCPSIYKHRTPSE